MKPHTHTNHTTHHASVIAAALSRLFPARRLVLALLFALLPALATTASAAPQFSTLTIGGTTYPDATKDLSGPGWTWTASTNTLELYDIDYYSGFVPYYPTSINGDIAFNTSNPGAATATINVSGKVIINGDISCQGTLLVNSEGRLFTVYGSLAGNLSVTYGNVTINDDITGSLSVDGGVVKVSGKVGGNLTVSGGAAIINGTVGGARDITGGTVKVNGSFIAGAPPAITASATISLNTLTPGIPASGTGWSFDGGTLYIEGSLINYTLTGAAPSGIGVYVKDAVNGSLTLDGVTINATDDYCNALEIDASNLTVYVKNNNTLAGNGNGICSGCDGVLTLAAVAGATLTAIGSEYEGIFCYYNDLVLQGSGTFNFYSGNSEDYGYDAICVVGSLLVQDSVTVNATAGDYTGNIPNNSGWNDGVLCWGDLTIADQSKLNAAGGKAAGSGCRAGGGIVLGSVLTVTSNATNALVATGGVGAVAETGCGFGIGASSDLLIAGTGNIKAVGDDAILALYDMTIAGCKITAQASGNASYALHAGGYNGATYAGGTVFITGGTTTASNITTPANIYYKTLNQTGGSLNGVGVNPGPGPNPDPNPNPNPDKKGGGGGAPSLPGLAVIAAMLATRALKKNGAKTRPDSSMPAE